MHDHYRLHPPRPAGAGVRRRRASVYTCPKLSEIQSYCKNEISTLWEQYRRRLNPHVYKVDLSYELYALRHQLLNAARTEQGDIPPMQ